jgi:hypothetical protein
LQDALVAERLLGRALVEAIVEGRNWFTDRSELERLAGLNTLQILQEQIARYLRCWDDSGVSLYFRGEGFSVSVAQYQVESLDRLREKLIQFPSGTKFVLWLSDYRAKTHDAEVAEIRRLLVSHGMSMQVKRTES